MIEIQSKSIKKIFWITTENFFDTDMVILPRLNKIYELDWIFILPYKKSGNYNESIIQKYADENKIKVEIFDLEYRFRDLRIIKKYYQIIKKIKQKNYKVVYCNILGLPYFYPLLRILVKRENIVYAIHDVIDHINIPNRKLMQFYQKFIFSCFNNFHIFSKNQLQYFNKMYPGKNVLFAPQNIKDFGSTTAQQPSDYIRFLFFGSIRENKGLEILIGAANRLAKTYKGKFVVAIYGISDNWEYYEKLIEDTSVFELRIENIPNEDIPDLFGRSHYLVLPYLDVTQSGPLLIAYNYNIPAIASNLPGFREYIKDNYNGLLFESKNVEALSTLIEKIIISNNQSYCEIKSNLKTFIDENISINRIIEYYQGYFDKIS